MIFSAYQIESLLEDLQKNIFPMGRTSSDPVSISEEVLDESRQFIKKDSNNSSRRISPKIISNLIEDKTSYDPIVDYVQQSRAGRFVIPPFVPEKKPPSFPLVKNFSRRNKEIAITMDKKNEEETLDKKNLLREIEKEKNFSDKKSDDNETKIILNVHENSNGTNQVVNQNEINEIDSLKFSSTKKHISVTHLLSEIDEEHLGDSIAISREKDLEINENNDVVFGEGPILNKSISKFVNSYPESAIKFLLRKNLDGRPLPVEYENIYEKWENRGLTRGKLKRYFLKIMQWEKFPDLPVLEILKLIKEHIFDIREKKNGNK